MEILVIDSGSEHQESKIVQKFQKCHPSNRLLRTNNRELSQILNLAITKAQGEYQRMQIPTIGTTRSVSNYCPKPWTKTCIWLAWKPLQISCQMQNMARKRTSTSILNSSFQGVFCHITFMVLNFGKNLHEKVGFFEVEFKALGDYDFALRLISNGITSKYVPDAWGKMLWHDDALSTRDFTPFQEKQVIIERHRNTETVLAAYKPMLSTEQALLREEEILDECFLDLGLRSLCYYPQFSNEDPHLDLDMLDFSFSRKIEDKRFANNRLLRELLLGKSTKPSELLEREGVMQANLRFSETGIGAGEFHLYPSNFMFPTETKLKKMQNHYLFPRKDRTKGEKGNLFVFCLRNFGTTC